MLSSLNAVISTNESSRIIPGHVIYNPAYVYLQIPTENHLYLRRIVAWSYDCATKIPKLNQSQHSNPGYQADLWLVERQSFNILSPYTNSLE